MKALVACVFAAILAHGAGAAETKWPAIETVRGAVDVIYVANAENNGLELVIASPQRTPLYTLKCHTFDYPGRELLYTGLMQCYLFPWQRIIGERNLLDDATMGPNVDSRARFARHHVMPGCRAAPEWGALRHFWLRGMVVTLAVKDILYTAARDEPGKPRVESYRFEVVVQPYPDAKMERSQRIAETEPAWFGGDECPAR